MFLTNYEFKNLRVINLQFFKMSRRQLIEQDLADKKFSALLNDIRDFRLGLIRSLTKADLEYIQRHGFKFQTKTLIGKKEEVRQFVLTHPSLMAAEKETLKENFKILNTILKETKGNHSSAKTRINSDGYEEYDYEEEEPKPKPKPKPKKSKSKAVVKQNSTPASESSSDDDSPVIVIELPDDD